jgi:uncharacterized Ntn-hydrolase superfamily protein
LTRVASARRLLNAFCWKSFNAISLAMLALNSAAQATEPVATFSIVGFDARTGELGVAVQSRFFAVGSVVPWAEAGVGAIATQAFGNTTYGPRGLALLREGLSAKEALDRLLEGDAGRERRQVAIVDARGRAAAFTGSECNPWAGHELGEHFSVQGNILVGEETVSAMAHAFRETEGMLGEKLMRALEEGQRAGGDSRGMQSAALLIVKKGGGYGGFNDRYCDLRVDDHREPIAELRRLFGIWKVHALIYEGYKLVEEGQFSEAYDLGKEAVALDPQSGEPHYHRACFLSRGGRKAESLEQLRVAIERDSALASRARQDPDFKPIAEDPDFRELVDDSSR